LADKVDKVLEKKLLECSSRGEFVAEAVKDWLNSNQEVILQK
jgi:metal-responsive CopG/Arc/MetJ family transcriptional regulator